MTLTVLITSAAKRIGLSIAQHLAKQGHRVIITYHTSRRDAEALCAQYPQIQSYALDLRDDKAIEALWTKLADQHIDVLINNAALFKTDSVHAVSSEILQEHMSVNFLSPVLMTKYFILQGGRYAINMLDAWAQTSPVNFASYSISKRALHQFTQYMIDTLPTMKTFGILLGFTLYNERFPRAFFDSHKASHPSSVEGLLSMIDFLLHDDNIQGQIMDLTSWKKNYSIS